jgi:hypothetical protein
MVRKFLNLVFHDFTSQRESQSIEEYMVQRLQEEFYMLIKVLPRGSLAKVLKNRKNYIKCESTIIVFRKINGIKEIINRKS